MARGGARLRSGPAKDPHSRTSERAGFTLASLPNGGYDGKPPAFPLDRYRVSGPDGPDEKAMRSFRKRELALWRQLWKSPQAWAWSMPQYSYLVWDIAMYCRLMVLAGENTATAADRGLIPRYADRIGLSAAGLAALGWQITPDEMANRRMEGRDEAPEAAYPRRLRAV